MRTRWLVPALLVGLAGTAAADPAIAATADTPPAWTLDLRFPWDIALLDGNATVGVFGLGLDLDRNVTARWSLGVATEATFIMDIQSVPPPASPVSPIVRLRAGVDARYVFHEGTTWVAQHCGPVFEVPTRAWIGGRAGFETVDEGTTFGRFAEIAIGWDRVMGHVTVGPYLAVGVEEEPAAAYPVPGPDPFAGDPYSAIPSVAAPPSTDPLIGPYFTLGMRIGGA
jgi:hypothetical protein